VAGEHLPPHSPRAWESLLAERLGASGAPGPRFRLIRSDGRRAIVEVDQLTALKVRSAWGATPPSRDAIVVTPRRTWGTLVGAKMWLRASRPKDRR